MVLFYPRYKLLSIGPTWQFKHFDSFSVKDLRNTFDSKGLTIYLNISRRKE